MLKELDIYSTIQTLSNTHNSKDLSNKLNLIKSTYKQLLAAIDNNLSNKELIRVRRSQQALGLVGITIVSGKLANSALRSKLDIKGRALLVEDLQLLYLTTRDRNKLNSNIKDKDQPIIASNNNLL